MIANPSTNRILVDVREPDETSEGIIPTAKKIPLGLILDSGFSFASHGIKVDREQTEIVVYCRSGKRSAVACKALEEKSFKIVKNYDGSYLDWSAQQ